MNSETTSTRTPRKGALPPPPVAALSEALGVEGIVIDWLAGDGSDRCYYRLTPKSPLSESRPISYVLMQLSGADAEALARNGYDWVNLGQTLREQGVFVPGVVKALPAFAALIIEDYGDITLESEVFRLVAASDFSKIEKVYALAGRIATKFLTIPHSEEAAWTKRQFDAERFRWELDFFAAQYLQPALGFNFTQGEREQFGKDCARIADFLGGRSRFFTHRDFHSRNLMWHDGRLAVLDFQDARIGPASYDLVSLFFDSYVPFEGTFRKKIFDSALTTLATEIGGNIGSIVEEEWRPMLLQRQLKAIGSFGFLTLNKARGNYLQYARPALSTILAAGVSSDEWPFISHDLIGRMDAAIAKP